MMRPHWSKRTLALRSSTGVKRCSPVVCDENCWNCQSWLKKASSCLLVDLLGHVRAVDRLCMVLLCFAVLVPVCISKDGANGHWSSFALHWDGNMALYGTVKQHEAMHQAVHVAQCNWSNATEAMAHYPVPPRGGQRSIWYGAILSTGTSGMEAVTRSIKIRHFVMFGQSAFRCLQ